MKAITLVQSPASLSIHLLCLCSKDISVFVCLLPSAYMTPGSLGQSINPHTVQQQSRWLPSASCRYSLQLFSICRLQTPQAGSSAMPAADMSRFQREQNKSPKKCVIAWCPWGFQTPGDRMFPVCTLIIKRKISIKPGGKPGASLRYTVLQTQSTDCVWWWVCIQVTHTECFEKISHWRGQGKGNEKAEIKDDSVLWQSGSYFHRYHNQLFCWLW